MKQIQSFSFSNDSIGLALELTDDTYRNQSVTSTRGAGAFSQLQCYIDRLALYPDSWQKGLGNLFLYSITAPLIKGQNRNIQFKLDKTYRALY